ncbi:MAG: site-specific integrase [Bacillota bacterium]|nr:site-specific integrase [Bacillota bacterium]
MKGYYRKRGKTWYYTIDVGIKPDTGDRDQRSKGGFKTKKEAQLAAAVLMNELDQGTYVKEAEITFEDFKGEWLGLYQATGRVKVSTVRVREHESGRLLAYFAKYKMKNITRKLYQSALNDLKDKGLAHTTLEGIHCTGRMIFKKAVELGYIKVDPTQYAIIPRTQKTVDEIESETEVPEYLEKDELSSFLKMAKENGFEMDYIIFLTLAYTGMRAGELCALKWKDIDFENQTISITKTYYNPKNNIRKYQLLPPKTKSSIRIIEIDAIVLAELELHQSRQKIVKMEHRKVYHDKDFIFSMTEKNYGYPIYIKKIENRMNRLLKLAGLNTNLTPHSLRHTHTSLLAEARVGLEEIMERLGHSDDEITRRVYLHVTKTMKKEASQKFSELMRNL